MKLRTTLLLCLFYHSIVRADAETDQLKARVMQLEAEVKLLKERLAKLEGEKVKAPVPGLKVLPGEWDGAPPENIVAVCQSAANELRTQFPDGKFDPISIKYDAKQGPMVIYGKGTDGERRVLLSVKDTHWAQFAFQFAHEQCHILCQYRDGNKANLWFEESLCETASLFALRRMAETWKTKPPYSNWKSYAPHLAEYADARIKETDKLDGITLAQWYVRNAEELKKSGTNRKLNNVMAVALLPIFEKNPRYWQAVGYLNQWDPKKELTFKEYLTDWHERVPEKLKPFVVEVAGKLEIVLK